MAPGGQGARPGPGMPGALGRPPGWRRRGCRRPPRTGRTARVVGLHQATSSSRSGSVPPWRATAASTAYWSLWFRRPRKVGSGRNRSRSPSRGSGSVRLAPHQSSASAARWRNTSPGKVLSRGCSGASSPTSWKVSAPRASPSSSTRRAVAASSGVGRFLAGISPTVGQNHRSPCRIWTSSGCAAGAPGASPVTCVTGSGWNAMRETRVPDDRRVPGRPGGTTSSGSPHPPVRDSGGRRGLG